MTFKYTDIGNVTNVYSHLKCVQYYLYLYDKGLHLFRLFGDWDIS